MPSNVASERAVLAGIAGHGKDVYIEIEMLLSESIFTHDYNKVIYKCFKNILDKGQSIDFASILSSAQDLGLSEYVNKSDVLKHIRAVLEMPVNINNVVEHAAKIKRLEFTRNIKLVLRAIDKQIDMVTGDESLATIMSLVESPIQELSQSYVSEDKTTPKELGSSLDEYLNNLIENPCTQVGLPTGFQSFDTAIGGGLRRKCVDVIAARPKCGKSVLCDNVALTNALLGTPVLVLDTEMSEEDHYNRILANLSGVPINEIATGEFSKDVITLNKIKMAAEKLKTIPYYYISVSGRPFEETLSIIKRWILKVVGYDEGSRVNDCLVIYDYLKIMSSSDISNDMKEYQALGFQITKLHNLAVEYDFPCLTFCQLNRDGITKESTDAVSGSDRIIWLCTSFSILKAKTDDEIATDGIRAGNRKLVPIVSRHGPGIEGSGYICLRMDGELARLTHLGTVKELGKNKEFPQQNRNSEDEDGEEMESSFS